MIVQALPALPTISYPSSAETGTDGPHFAFVRVAPVGHTDTARDEAMRGEADAEWVAACRHLTPHIERTSARSALLELGTCSDEEASVAIRSLLQRLAALGLEARAGIGPSGVLAQFTLLGTPVRQRLRWRLASVSGEEVSALLRRMPVAILPQLHPQGVITPEIVERLHRYGLRTLGHIARLDELALRRQFGPAGSILAAVAEGRDTRPLVVTPAPEWLRIRLRLAEAATPAEVVVMLPAVAERMARLLRTRGRQSRALRLRVWWENGAVEHVRSTLRRYTDEPTLLAQETSRLLLKIILPHQPLHTVSEPVTEKDGLCQQRIEALTVALGDFAPLSPTQAAFWRTREQRMAALQQVADTLAQRHGRPLLLQCETVATDAIFSEEGYTFVGRERLSPRGAAGRRDATSRRRSNEQSARVASMDALASADVNDAWQEVPQRLHWW